MKRRFCLILGCLLVWSLTQQAQPAWIMEGLVAYYPLNGNYSNSITGNSGVVLESVDQAGFGLNRDGEEITAMYNQRITTDVSVSDSTFSVSMWFKTESTIDVNYLMDQGNDGTGTHFHIGPIHNRDGSSSYKNRIRFDFFFSGFDVYQDVSLDEWHHLVGTFDKNTRIQRLYYDGLLLGENINPRIFKGVSPLKFGNLQGGIDDVRVYDRSLSESEVTQLYGYEIGHNSYQVVEGTLTWSEAKADAERRGGHLATFSSASEYNYVLQQVLGNTYTALWIGATDERVEGQWEWVTGEDWTFENWAEGQPDNRDIFGSTHYAHLYGSSYNLAGLWNDRGNGGVPVWPDTEAARLNPHVNPAIGGYLLEMDSADSANDEHFTKLWELDLPQYEKPPAISTDSSYLVVSSSSANQQSRNQVHLIDLSEGFVKWTRTLDGAIRTVPIFEDSSSVIIQAMRQNLSPSGYLYKLTAEQGETEWRSDGVGLPTGAGIHDGTIYQSNVGNHTGGANRIAFARSSDGTIIVNKSAPSQLSEPPAISADGGYVYFGGGSFNPNVIAVNSQTGDTIWNFSSVVRLTDCILKEMC